MYPYWRKYKTHCVWTGTTGYGKTAGLEDAQRDRILAREGFCALIFDPNHWRRLNDYLIFMNPTQPVIRLNLSCPKEVVPCNWFCHAPFDLAAHANRLALAVAGQGQFLKNLNDYQNYANVMPAVVRWAAETRNPIQRAHWLEFGRQAEIVEAASMVKNPRTVSELNLLSQIDRFPDWSFRVGSTWNRLRALSDCLSLRLFTGLDGALNLQKCVDEKAIVLVNLSPSPQLTFEDATLFASLIISEFTLVYGDYYLDLDEAPYYCNFDVVKMLDLMGKRGMRVTLICHDPRQFEDPRIQVSLDVNARIRVVFGGMRHEEKKKLAVDFFTSKLNSRWEPKERYYSYQTTGFDIENYSTQTVGEFGESETFTERLVPRIEKIESGTLEWSMEERLSVLAEKMSLEEREYLVQLPDGVRKGRIPHLDQFLISDAQTLRFMKRHPQGIGIDEALEKTKEETHVRRETRRKPYRAPKQQDGR